MITNDELLDAGLVTNDNTEYYDKNGPNIMFNIKQQILYEHSEVTGVGEKICVVTDISELIDLYFVMFNYELN